MAFHKKQRFAFFAEFAILLMLKRTRILNSQRSMKCTKKRKNGNTLRELTRWNMAPSIHSSYIYHYWRNEQRMQDLSHSFSSAHICRKKERRLPHYCYLDMIKNVLPALTLVCLRGSRTTFQILDIGIQAAESNMI